MGPVTDTERNVEDLMLAIGRLTTYVFDTPQRLTTVRENLEAVEGHLKAVADRLAAARGRGEEPQDVQELHELQEDNEGKCLVCDQWPEKCMCFTY